MIDTIVNENEISFNRLEKEIYKAACEMACRFLGNILEDLDEKIVKERDKSQYRHKGKRKTTLKTLMGEVEFSRTVYKHYDESGKKSYVFLLDQELGFDTIGLVSTNLAEKIVENATLVSYRNTAKNVTELTGQSISHSGAWNVIQALGKKVKEDEEQQVKALERNKIIGKKTREIIFEEADGVWINMQGKDRPKKGKKREMKVAVAYEGWKKSGKNRYELVNKMACAGFESTAEFYKKKEAMIAKEYNVDEINMRILNGDGASWISDKIDSTVHYQLDPFHKYQAVVRSVRNKEQRKTLMEMLRKNKIKATLEYITFLANEAWEEKDEKRQEKLVNLYKYFNNNKEGLLPYNERNLKIPEAPEGLVYRNLGTMEHHICDIIAQRMKHRKSSWSIEGAGNLGKLLAAKKSGNLHKVINNFSKVVLSENKTVEIIEILSAAKTPKKDGKGKDGNIQKGLIPFRNCAVTNGRKAIQNMMGTRNFSDLIYR